MKRLAALLLPLMLGACAGAAAMSEPWRGSAEGWTPAVAEIRTVGLGMPGGVRLASGVRFAGGIQIIARAGDRLHGLSDLGVRNEELLAVTDAGDLVRARIVVDDRGRPVGLAELRLRSMTGPDGGPFASKSDGAAESLVTTADGELIVGFEQTPRLWSYGRLDRLRDRPTALATPPVPVGNAGIEAIGLSANGWRVAGEGGGLWDCDRAACREVAAPPEPPVAVEDWRISGMDRDPLRPGWYVVERLYREPFDMRARVRRMEPSGALGPVLFALSLPSTVDNFEGIAAVDQAGTTRLWILSDDNDSPKQRTLLLAFDVRSAR